MAPPATVRQCRAAVSLAVALIFSACAAPPGVAIPVPADEASGPSPDLVPLSPILAAAAAQVDGARTSPEAAGALDDRAAALRSRAAALRGEVVPAPLRDRLEAGVPRTALP